MKTNEIFNHLESKIKEKEEPKQEITPKQKKKGNTLFYTAIISMIIITIGSFFIGSYLRSIEYQTKKYNKAHVSLLSAELRENKKCMKDVVNQFTKSDLEDFNENVFYGCFNNTTITRQQLKSYGVETSTSDTVQGLGKGILTSK